MIYVHNMIIYERDLYLRNNKKIMHHSRFSIMPPNEHPFSPICSSHLFLRGVVLPSWNHLIFIFLYLYFEALKISAVSIGGEVQPWNSYLWLWLWYIFLIPLPLYLSCWVLSSQLPILTFLGYSCIPLLMLISSLIGNHNSPFFWSKNRFNLIQGYWKYPLHYCQYSVLVTLP